MLAPPRCASMLLFGQACEWPWSPNELSMSHGHWSLAQIMNGCRNDYVCSDETQQRAGEMRDGFSDETSGGPQPHYYFLWPWHTSVAQVHSDYKSGLSLRGLKSCSDVAVAALFFNPIKPGTIQLKYSQIKSLKINKEVLNCLILQAFLAYIVWYSVNIELILWMIYG